VALEIRYHNLSYLFHLLNPKKVFEAFVPLKYHLSKTKNFQEKWDNNDFCLSIERVRIQREGLLTGFF